LIDCNHCPYKGLMGMASPLVVFIALYLVT
jgi:hypothetical protein